MGSRRRDRSNALRTWLGAALLHAGLVAAFLSVVPFQAQSQSPFYDEQYAEEQEPAEAPVPLTPLRLVPMPRVTIYPNDTVTDDMLIDREYDGEDPKHAVFTTREGLVGKVSKQTLLPNTPVAINAVREPFAIKLGQPAVVYFKSGGLFISGTAVPLQAGAVGELIALRNVESNMTIRGIVQADGTVRVGP